MTEAEKTKRTAADEHYIREYAVRVKAKLRMAIPSAQGNGVIWTWRFSKISLPKSMDA
jgi:hypothetical protein